MDIAPGLVIANRFRLIAQVGKGGMGSVWKTEDTGSGEILALKLLHPWLAQDEDYVARFEREVELSQRIVSPNVVQVTGFGRSDGVPFIAMEFVDGESLRDRLRRTGPMEWPEAAAIALQVLVGLAAAHAKNVLHRDIKPGNILLARSGVVKVADFGIAKATDLTGLTGSATMLGTPAYMAPDDEESIQSDLYSLGCVVFEMLTGAPPFEGSSMHSILMKHARTPINLEGMPVSAGGFVGRMTQKDALQRPASAVDAMFLESLKVPVKALVPSVTKTVPTLKSEAVGVRDDFPAQNLVRYVRYEHAPGLEKGNLWAFVPVAIGTLVFSFSVIAVAWMSA